MLMVVLPSFYLWRCSREIKYHTLFACTSPILRSGVEEPGNEATVQLHFTFIRTVRLNNSLEPFKNFLQPAAVLGECVFSCSLYRLTHCLINSPANLTLVGFHESCYDVVNFVK